MAELSIVRITYEDGVNTVVLSNGDTLKGLTEVNASAEARDVQKFEIHGYILRPKRNPAE